MNEPQTKTDADGGGSGGTTILAPSGFPDDIRAIGDQIAQMKPEQAKDLRLYLKKVLTPRSSE